MMSKVIKIRYKHNKKRNTAFVYEALLREATVATMRGDHRRRAAVIRIMKRHFGAVEVKNKECKIYFQQEELKLICLLAKNYHFLNQVKL